MNELRLNELPDLPQRITIVEVASQIWHDDQVVAVWIGGSLARGAGDVFSDVDFRVAVAPEQIEDWKTPSFEHIFTRAAVVGQNFLQFGNGAFLHHLVLANGEIFDFFVQSTEQLPTAEPLLILGCRNAAFERTLLERNIVPQIQMQAVEKETIKRLLVSFWINTHKHRKVLHRGLDLMVTQGVHGERNMLMRLWYIQATGEDCGDTTRQTIHGLTRIVHSIEQAIGPQALELIGAPMRNRQEIYQAIELNRAVVSQVGRQLAQMYEVDYPSALEATVVQGWAEFVKGS